MAAFKAQQFQKAKRQAFDAGLPVVRVFSTTEAVSLAPKRVLQIVCDALRLDEGSGVVYQQPMWGCSSAEGRSSIGAGAVRCVLVCVALRFMWGALCMHHVSDMSFEVTCAATRHTNKKVWYMSPRKTPSLRLSFVRCVAAEARRVGALQRSSRAWVLLCTERGDDDGGPESIRHICRLHCRSARSMLRPVKCFLICLVPEMNRTAIQSPPLVQVSQHRPRHHCDVVLSLFPFFASSAVLSPLRCDSCSLHVVVHSLYRLKTFVCACIRCESNPRIIHT